MLVEVIYEKPLKALERSTVTNQLYFDNMAYTIRYKLAVWPCQTESKSNQI